MKRTTYYIDLWTIPKLRSKTLKISVMFVYKGHPSPLGCGIEVGRSRARSPLSLPGR